MQPAAFLNAALATASSLPSVYVAFSQHAAVLLVTSIWQGAVLASGLALCLRFASRLSASHRFAVWAAGFAALICLPLLPFLSHLVPAAHSVSAGGLLQAATKPWLQLDIRWSLAIAALWFIAAAIRAFDLVIHSVRLRKLWKSAIPIEPGTAQFPAAATTLSRQIKICTTQSLERPSAIGFFRPRILIPDWLLGRLTPAELDQIVLHETEHLRRRDDWTNLLQKLCLVLFPLNPALWWIERRLCREREMACDEGVVKLTRAPRAYAACLASLAERGLQHRAQALSLGAWQRRPELVARVHRILTPKSAPSPFAASALIAALGCGLLSASVELSRCPQLIAFLPAKSVESAQVFPNDRLPFESAAYIPVRMTDATAPQFHATQLKAVLPAIRPAKPLRIQPSLPHATTQPGAPAAFDASFEPTTPLSEQPNDPRPTTLSATASNPAQAQQWIVLTAWTEVQFTQQSTPEQPQNDSSENAAQTNQPSTEAQASAHSPSQITVTRLIFRVLPATPTSTQPATTSPVRGGWFVIQL